MVLFLLTYIISGACWYYSSMRVTFTEAEEECERVGAHLVVMIDDSSRDHAFRFAVYSDVPVLVKSIIYVSI